MGPAICNKQQPPVREIPRLCLCRAAVVERAGVAGMVFTFKSDIPTLTLPLFTDPS